MDKIVRKALEHKELTARNWATTLEVQAYLQVVQIKPTHRGYSRARAGAFDIISPRIKNLPIDDVYHFLCMHGFSFDPVEGWFTIRPIWGLPHFKSRVII